MWVWKWHTAVLWVGSHLSRKAGRKKQGKIHPSVTSIGCFAGSVLLSCKFVLDQPCKLCLKSIVHNLQVGFQLTKIKLPGILVNTLFFQGKPPNFFIPGVLQVLRPMGLMSEYQICPKSAAAFCALVVGEQKALSTHDSCG